MTTGQIIERVSQRLGLGATLVEALESVGDKTLLEAARRGDKLSLVFEKGGAEPHIVRALSQIEDGGDVASGLGRLAEVELETEAIRESVKSALLYPRTLLVTWCVVCVFFLSAVAGPLKELYASMNQTLPWLTRVMFVPVESIQNPVVLVLILLSISGLWRVLPQHPLLDGLCDWVPYVGEWHRRRDAMSYFLWLELSLEQGVPLPQASRQAATVCQSLVFRKMMLAVSERLERGDDLSHALESCSRLPKGTLWLVSLAERKELKGGSLGKVSDFLGRGLEQSTERKLALLEPVAVFCLGSLVGFVVAVALAPLQGMLDNLG